jgi:hypothetical protein
LLLGECRSAPWTPRGVLLDCEAPAEALAEAAAEAAAVVLAAAVAVRRRGPIPKLEKAKGKKRAGSARGLSSGLPLDCMGDARRARSAERPANPLMEAEYAMIAPGAALVRTSTTCGWSRRMTGQARRCPGAGPATAHESEEEHDSVNLFVQLDGEGSGKLGHEELLAVLTKERVQPRRFGHGKQHGLLDMCVGLPFR